MRFQDLEGEYATLWASMVCRSSFKDALKASANKIIANKARYEAVSSMTNVPWFVVGLIHQMEAGCDFGCHLHNGDPLSARTVSVPAKRPATGKAPYKWEASACDALTMKRLEAIKDWTIERICFELERYNGWGYRNYHPTTLSPYLWSGTTHYARGKYVADGKWSSSAVSGQSGAMPLLKTLMELDSSITLGQPLPEVKPEPQETEACSFKKADEKQVPMAAKVMTAALAGGFTFPSIPAPPLDVVSNVAGWQTSAETLVQFAKSPSVAIAICGILISVVAPLIAKRFA